MDAEKFMMERTRRNKGGRQKSEPMDETHDRNRFESRGAAETKKIKKAQDDSAVHDSLRRPPLPINTSQAAAEEEQTELAGDITRIKPGIDLKSSHASKFLMQAMPWELQPSPLTPFTPAAVPFKWEEIPGKPKIQHEANRLTPKINSFPVLHPPPRLLRPPSAATKKLPVLQSQSVAQHSRSSSECCSSDENRVISVEMKRVEESPGLYYKLPSPWNGDVKPAYSPFRDLGPPDDAIQRLRTKATSTLSRIWRKSNPRKRKPKPNSAPPVSSCGRGKVLMDREALWMEVNESTQTNHSLNARIAAAMGGVDDGGFSNKTMMCLWEAKDPRPIPDSEYYRNGLRLVEKRPRRKWLMRKLRRPAQFFRAFFSAVRRAVSLRKSRRGNRKNIYLPYESLVG